MADFITSLKITGGNEGGISNDANDNGQFTYAGIASAYWPNWLGFPFVHKALADNNGNVHESNIALENNTEVQQLVNQFYKTNFWDVNKLDQITDQQIANNVYDFGVNSGVGTAAKMLQKVVGVTQDGIIGNVTIATVNDAVPEQVYNEYNSARSDFYHKLALKPDQAQFLHSWLSRLVPYRS